MENRKQIRMIAWAAVMVITCSCKHNNPKPILPPGKAGLLAPAQNAACATGTVLSDTTSSVTFTWNASDNTGSYTLSVKDLLTGTSITQQTNNTQSAVTLLRNTPYSWYVVSQSSKTTTTSQSDTWKFYNAGVGTVSYAPFPVTIVSPSFGAIVTATNGTVNLKWIGSSVNNDIAGYDVYFGTVDTPALLKSGVTDMFLNNVSVTSGTTYYWKVVTKDSVGNTSDSEVSQFIVK